ncbi:MAG: hypothetical protein R2880_13620 [Deinococcales bacterium]
MLNKQGTYLLLCIFFFCSSFAQEVTYQIDHYQHDFEACRGRLINQNVVLSYYKGLPLFLLKSSFTNIEPFLTEELYTSFSKIQQVLQRRGIALVVVPIPPRPLVLADYLDQTKAIQASYQPAEAEAQYMAFIQNLQLRGIVAVDVLSPLGAYQGDDPLNTLLERHWTPVGAMLSARAVTNEIKAKFQTMLVTLEPTFFQNEVSGWVSRTALLTEKINQICHSNLTSKVLSYESISQTSSDQLFADIPIQAVAVGTSYSQPLWNFADSLKSQLAIEIINAYIPGGGMFSSIENFFLNETFLQQDIKLLIWEFPFINLVERPSFDELIPLLASTYCEPIYDETLNPTVTDPSLPLIVNLENKLARDLLSSPSFLKIELEDKIIRDFPILLEGDSSFAYKRFNRDLTVTNNGQFFWELPANLGTLKSLKIYLPDTYQKSITLTFCRY